jgi:N utilization substance protein B
VPARSKARKRALDVLFEADVRSADRLVTLEQWEARADPPVPAYSSELVRGVAEHAARIDELISTYARDWTLERMPPVDRAILRLAVFELLCDEAVPSAVVIDEAVELAKSLSTDQSSSFVNGVLSRMHRDRDDLALQQAP